jgi:hypothetical protein
MSNDLERFLQKAAERLKEKMQQQESSQRPPSTPPRQRAPIGTSSGPEVVEATIVNPRSLGDNPLSSIDTRPSVATERPQHLAKDISQTDERMEGRMQQVFEHSVSRLPNASGALQQNAGRSPDQTDQAIEVNRRDRMSSPFLRMLRKPATLRAAFVASEIFRRKF